jgi:hypothetical protein
VNAVDATRVKMMAYRKLRRLSRYRPVGVLPAPSYLSGLPLAENDEILGVYENVIGQRQGCVVFSTQGIYADVDVGWTFIPYARMLKVDVEMPGGDKHKAEAMQIQMEGNGSQTVVITGRDSKIREIWNVYTFLSRVLYPIKAGP